MPFPIPDPQNLWHSVMWLFCATKFGVICYEAIITGLPTMYLSLCLGFPFIISLILKPTLKY